jgi:hypothetical protein
MDDDVVSLARSAAVAPGTGGERGIGSSAGLAVSPFSCAGVGDISILRPRPRLCRLSQPLSCLLSGEPVGHEQTLLGLGVEHRSDVAVERRRIRGASYDPSSVAPKGRASRR